MNALHVAERSAVYALEGAVAPVTGEAFDLLATAPQGVAKLRELILSLAVRGRLVAQSPTDIPASKLLEQISAGRKAQPTVCRTRRRNGRPHSSDEMPFDVPGSWTWVGLADITYEHGQQTPSAPITYIDVASIDSVRGCIKSELPIVAASEAPSRARKLVEKGTVIYSTVRPYLKNIAIISEAYDPTPIASTAFAVLHPNEGLLSKYLYYYLRSAEFTSFVASRMIGVAYPAINDASFFEGVLPLPPLAEQRRIVARVEELMGLCDELETRGRLQDEQHARLVATLFDALVASASPAELADNWRRVARHFDLLLDRPAAVEALEQTILQLAVRGLLVPQDPADEPFRDRIDLPRDAEVRASVRRALRHTVSDDLGTDETHAVPTPSAWKWLQIDLFCEVQGGIQKTPLRRPVRHHFPYLRVANVQRGSLSLDEIARYELADDELEKWRLHAGDLLVVEGNGSEDEIGRCAIWDGSIDPCVFQNHLIRVRPHATSAVRFLALFLNSPDGIAEMKRLAITTSGLFNLSVGKIRKIAIPVPPLAEQHRIVARVEELRSLCADLRRHLQQAQTTQSNLADALVNAAVQDNPTSAA